MCSRTLLLGQFGFCHPDVPADPQLRAKRWLSPKAQGRVQQRVKRTMPVSIADTRLAGTIEG